MSDNIDKILAERRRAAQPVESVVAESDKFFSVLLGEGLQEQFLELQHANGMQTCFSYGDLSWFTHDPEGGAIDLAFGAFAITLKGRGLKPLFVGIKQKRVAWVKEADQEMQDHPGNETYIEEIAITPPEGFGALEADNTGEES